MRMAISVILLAASCAAAPQSPRDLFERARLLDESNQNLNEAIKLYSSVVEQAKEVRALAAEAQFRVGVLYERLGRKEEAQRAFRAVVSGYGDQADAVRQARAKITGPQPEGVVTRQVWAGRDVDQLGAPTPDGRYLSFTDWETGDLAIRDLATGEKRRLTKKGSWSESPEFALFSVPSPDGKQVAYSWYNKDWVFDLRVAGLDGSPPRVLYRNAEVDYVQPSDWSPDGKQIVALFSRTDRTHQIVLVSVPDGSVRVLKKSDLLPYFMHFSPDGRYLAYNCAPRKEDREGDIFLLDLESGREVALVQHPADDEYPLWTPDGKGIVFASDRMGHWGMWHLEVGGGRPRGVPALIKPDFGRGILPMGLTRKGLLYYGVATGMNDVYTAEIDLATGKVLAGPTPVTQKFVGSNTAADWSPDGRHLAYLSGRGPTQAGAKTVCIRSVESGQERELTLKINWVQWVRWSPDGKSLLSRAQQAGRRGLYRVDSQTGDAIPLVEEDPGSYVGGPAAWSSDGSAIIFRRETTAAKKSAIVVRNLESGRERDLLAVAQPSLLRSLAVSNDGAHVAFLVQEAEKQSTVLKVMPAAGGEARELLRLVYPEGFVTIAWTPDGRDLLFGRRPKATEPRTELWRVPAQGGRPQPLGLAMDGLRSPSVHPDGRRIAFTAGEYKSEVWVMENFLPVATAKAAR
ncbi:MAG: tetratricopeptide repeat protein [Acidobacteriota bacterium]|mgnify:CR=1 FL=1